MAVTDEDVALYVGLEAEYADAAQMKRVSSARRAAEAWLAGAVGENVNLSDPRAEELVLMAAGELFENRALTDDRLSKFSGSKALASLNRFAGDVIMQLQLDGGAQNAQP